MTKFAFREQRNLADLGSPAGFSRDQLHEALLTGSPEALVSVLKQDLRVAFALECEAVIDGYSVEEHGITYCRQDKKCIVSESLPPAYTPELRSLHGVLHDLGKGLEALNKDQHGSTTRELRRLADTLPLTPQQLSIELELIQDDLLGKALRKIQLKQIDHEHRLDLNKRLAEGCLDRQDIIDYNSSLIGVSFEGADDSINQLASAVRERAARVELAPQEFLDIWVATLTVDVLSYTMCAERDAKRSLGLLSRFEDLPVQDLAHKQRAKETNAFLRNLTELHLPTRSFISLDYVFELDPDFDISSSPAEKSLFLIDPELGRPRFQAGQEEFIKRLRAKL